MLHFFGRQQFTKLQGVNKFCCTKNHDIEKLLHNYPLIASISSASMLSSISCKTSVRVFQVTGCLPHFATTDADMMCHKVNGTQK